MGYLREYQQDVINALFRKNNRFIVPRAWRSLMPGDAAVIAPVMN